MPKVFLDFETFCDLPVTEVGLYKHVSHPSFHPWCCAYAVDDGPINLWKWGDDLSLFHDMLYDPHTKIVAFNAEYELGVFNAGWWEGNAHSDQFIDCQALAGVFGFPLNLDGFCKAIGSSELKDKPNGTRLINKLCIKQKPTAFNPEGKNTPDTHPKEFLQLYEYCIQDVKAMREAYYKLPQENLSALESLVWRHTILQNSRGLPIDIQLVKRIKTLLGQYNRHLQEELNDLTNGQVTTGKQVQRIREFLENVGLSMPSLGADIVKQTLENSSGLPPVAVRVLELRQLLAHSSTAKFQKIIDMALGGRVHGNLKYYGAHTGRFTGQGLQVHNLPRATLDNPEETIEYVKKGNGLDPNFNQTASALIRPSIQASPGKKLIVCDYKSIENVVLHWTANDQQTIQDFRDGKDQYKAYAAKRFRVPYDEVTPEQRKYAKPNVLGLGYGGGWAALVSVAQQYGVKLDQATAKDEVNFYRYKQYPKIPQLWNEVFQRAKLAVATRDPQIYYTGTTKLEFRCAGGYLFILLPSGRRLAYPQPKINDEWYITVKGRQVPMAAGISYMGVKNKAWLRLGIHPGLMTENIVQAMARDILVYGMLCCEQAGFQVLASVHDEIIAEVPDNSQWALSEMITFACTLQGWSKDIPISADGYEGYRYKKD